MAEKYTLEHVVELCKEFDKTGKSELLAKAYFESADLESPSANQLGRWMVRKIAKCHQIEAILPKK